MKHSLKVTLTLVGLFLVAQGVGLGVVFNYIDLASLSEKNQVSFSQLPYSLERPVVTPSYSFAYILFAVLIGTALMLILVRYKKKNVWKVWYAFSVIATLSIALSSFIPSTFAFLLSLLVCYFKVYKPNIYVHNISEVFIYGGLAAIFVPLMNFFSVFLLLTLISLYDMYAVWKSKHMVALAEFQTESKLFAGLAIPYVRKSKSGVASSSKVLPTSSNNLQKKPTMAILGGGDIGFPLLFSGVILKENLLHYSILDAFLLTLTIPLFCAVALLFLMIKGESGKFYPAMPFLSIGCLAGFVVLKVFSGI